MTFTCGSKVRSQQSDIFAFLCSRKFWFTLPLVPYRQLPVVDDKLHALVASEKISGRSTIAYDTHDTLFASFSVWIAVFFRKVVAFRHCGVTLPVLLLFHSQSLKIATVKVAKFIPFIKNKLKSSVFLWQSEEPTQEELN